MKKDSERDRIIGIFSTYARLGLESERNVLGIVVKIYGCLGPESTLDMLAVFDTLRLLEYLGKSDALLAVRRIYFDRARKATRACEISYAILRLSFELSLDERTIYRRLTFARRLWSSLRKSYGDAQLTTRESINSCAMLLGSAHSPQN